MKAEAARRPVKARDTRWAAALARALCRARVRPNTVSLLSVVCAAAAAAALATTPHVRPGVAAVLYLLAALCIPLRLLCNLLDGMVAIEGGFRTRVGELYNEIPDRVSDALILVAAGYSGVPYGPALGWTAALLAVMTAYVRALGGSAGARQHFVGPMAKQQRMVLVAAASLLAVGELALGRPHRAMAVALLLISVGCVATVVRRVRLIAQDLNTPC